MKIISLLIICAAALCSRAEELRASRDLMSDTWCAVDALGRRLPVAGDAPAVRTNRFVGLFYYIWHGAHGYSNEGGAHDQNRVKVPAGADLQAPFVIPEILRQPEAERKWGPVNRFHHWGEPLFGFYVANDDWVIRRHAQMLSDAGVDVILFDVTNGFSYRDIYLNLCRVYTDIRREGGATPQFAFLCNGSLVKAAERAAAAVFSDLYKPGKYRDLWFQWKGKPLILGDPAAFTDEMKAFFTIRNSWAWSRGGGGGGRPTPWFGEGRDCWNWLDYTPQNYGWHESPERPEQVPVAAAQHPTTDMGKSYRDGRPMHPPETAKGHYFAEQWQRALAIDPEFILITQWNEWVAQRFINKGEPHFKVYAGKPSKPGDSVFVDVFDQEYNRDIEPMKGGYGDNYYYQMIDGIRRFKGVRPPLKAGPPKTIALGSQGADQWRDVAPEYRDSLYDTTARDHHGWGGAGPYRNATGRNDFAMLKVARDAAKLYFLAQCRDAITAPDGANWMELFVSDGSSAPSWEGFQYRLRLDDAAGGVYAVERSLGGFEWRRIGDARFAVAGNRLQLAVDRALFGSCAAEESLDFYFKWLDNRQTASAVDWLVHGDTAPNARFMYRYAR